MTPQRLSEDDLYRTSTQYRLWSFSPASLAEVRNKTHQLARERVRRSTEGTTDNSGGTEDVNNGTSDGADAAFLSQEEENKLVQRYCDQICTTCDHLARSNPRWNVNVKATAVQYLRRFYLFNSPVTYPPKEVYKTCLFLACKTEVTHTTVSEYARKIKSQPDDILAPEYKVMQALRFTLDVRHPFRALKGARMELQEMGEGRLGQTHQQEMASLGSPSSRERTQWNTLVGRAQQEDVKLRIEAAYAAAKALLERAALLTDVYFLYTPSQIMFGALHLADSHLTEYYLSTKVPNTSAVKAKVLASIHTCANMLDAFDEKLIMNKDQRTAMEDKLEKCRDPSTRDLVAKHLAAKRGGSVDGLQDDGKAKKRRMEREKNEREGEDLFGPALPNPRQGTAP